MSWTNSCSAAVYEKFIRQHHEYFDEDTIDEAETRVHLAQTQLTEFAEAA